MKIALIILAVLVALVLGRFLMLASQSKNGEAPGLVAGKLAPCPTSPNCVSSEDGTAESHAVEPLPLEAWATMPARIERAGGVITVQQENYIAATFTSGVFKFVDDLELRKGDTALHIRSASRVGHSDLGVNKKRVDALRVD